MGKISKRTKNFLKRQVSEQRRQKKPSAVEQLAAGAGAGAKKRSKQPVQRKPVKRLQKGGVQKRGLSGGNGNEEDDDDENEDDDDDDEGSSAGKKTAKKSAGKKSMESMDVDEFMNAIDQLSDEDDDEGDDDDDEVDDEVDDDDDDGEEGLQDDEESNESDQDGMDTSADNAKVQAAKKKTTELKSAVSQHKEQLERLKQRDPEFYKFLQENDKNLLSFGAGETDEPDEEAEDGDDEVDDDLVGDSELIDEGGDDLEQGDEEDEQAHESFKKKKVAKKLTKERVDKWATELSEKNSLKTLRHAVVAFRTACHLYDTENDKKSEYETEQISKRKRKKSRKDQSELSMYTIESAGVYNSIISVALKHGVAVLLHHLGAPTVISQVPQEQASSAPSSTRSKLISQHKNWGKLKVVTKSFVSNALHLLRSLTDSSLTSFVLQNLERAILLFAPFPKICRALLKTLLELWSHADEHVRIMAFLAIRKMAFACPFPFLDLCLKSTYLTFVRNCKFTTAQTFPLINFMLNCVVEIYGIDMWSTYQHAFVYIRQLAIHLRNALTLKKKEAFRNVYNWQFIHCLNVWTRILSAFAGKNSPAVTQSQENILAALVYPLAQVIGGTVRLIPTARYFPLRFHCIRYLNTLSEATEVFVPVLPFIIEVLDSSGMKKRFKPSTTKPIDFNLVLKVPKAFTHTKVFQDSVLEAVLFHLLEHFSIHASSISLPELALPALLQLRKVMKNSHLPALRKQVKQVVDKLEEGIKFTSNRRAAVTFSPKDLSQVRQWEQTEESLGHNPVRKYFIAWRKTEEQRKQRLMEIQANSFKKDAENGKHGEDDQEEEGDDDDDDDDFSEDESSEDDDDIVANGDEFDDNGGDEYDDGEDDEDGDVQRMKTESKSFAKRFASASKDQKAQKAQKALDKGKKSAKPAKSASKPAKSAKTSSSGNGSSGAQMAFDDDDQADSVGDFDFFK